MPSVTNDFISSPANVFFFLELYCYLNTRKGLSFIVSPPQWKTTKTWKIRRDLRPRLARGVRRRRGWLSRARRLRPLFLLRPHLTDPVRRMENRTRQTTRSSSNRPVSVKSIVSGRGLEDVRSGKSVKEWRERGSGKDLRGMKIGELSRFHTQMKSWCRSLMLK